MRLLIVANDTTTDDIQRLVSGKGFAYEFAETGEEAVDMVAIYQFDAIILDLAIDNGHGVPVIRHLRSARNLAPIIAIRSEDKIDETVAALSAGADDVVATPVQAEEFVARLNATVRRANGFSTSVITVGDLAVDLDTMMVSVKGKGVRLSRMEFEIVEALALRKTRTLSKEMLLDHLYANGDAPNSKVIDVYMCKIRGKLSKVAPGVEYIETVWGRGYCLKAPNAKAA